MWAAGSIISHHVFSLYLLSTMFLQILLASQQTRWPLVPGLRQLLPHPAPPGLCTPQRVMIKKSALSTLYNVVDFHFRSVLLVGQVRFVKGWTSNTRTVVAHISSEVGVV